MICKASQRGGGAQLAAHLCNTLDNDRVEIADMRGSVAKDLAGAFREWYAQSKITSCTKYLYSLSISPDQKQGRLTKEQYLDLIGRYEKSLKLSQQGRVVVFHEKKDKDGVPREHCHVVWSRIDARAGRAVTISFDRFKRLAITRAFAKELGRTVPRGMELEPGPEKFALKSANANHKEKQQEERSGITKEQRRKEVTEAWQKSHDGPSFVEALKRRGYYLTQGGRLSYAVVDVAGHVHPMGTLVAGVRAAEVKVRLAESHPIPSLPPPEEVRQQVAAIRDKPRQQRGRPALDADALRNTLKKQQGERRADLAKQRAKIEQRHTRERLAMPKPPEPDGLVKRLAAQFKAEARANRALERRHKAELRDITRQEKNLTTLDAREARSLETKIRRHDIQGLVESFRYMAPLIESVNQKKQQPTIRPSFEQSASTSRSDEARRAAERLQEMQREMEKLRQNPKLRP